MGWLTMVSCGRICPAQRLPSCSVQMAWQWIKGAPSRSPKVTLPFSSRVSPAGENSVAVPGSMIPVGRKRRHKIVEWVESAALRTSAAALILAARSGRAMASLRLRPGSSVKSSLRPMPSKLSKRFAARPRLLQRAAQRHRRRPSSSRAGSSSPYYKCDPDSGRKNLKRTLPACNQVVA